MAVFRQLWGPKASTEPQAQELETGIVSASEPQISTPPLATSAVANTANGQSTSEKLDLNGHDATFSNVSTAAPSTLDQHNASEKASEKASSLPTTDHTSTLATPTPDPAQLPNTPSPDPPSTSSSEALPPHPPSLNYTLEGRKFTIFWFWTLIAIDVIAVPIVLYFCLWYLTDLSHNAVFSISTACLGGVSVVEYFIRFHRLWKKGSTCRTLNGRRWYLDWFHWNFSAAWIFIMVELIVGTVPDEPPIRLLAMPVSSLLYWFGCELVLADILRLMGVLQPCRISSVPKGEPFRPAIYPIVEDVCAVDGSGGQEFRRNLNARFEASHYFRQMFHRLTLFWGVGALATATLTTILVFTLERDAAYVVGWVLPCIWAGVWTLGTIPYVKKCLKHEREDWARSKANRMP